MEYRESRVVELVLSGESHAGGAVAQRLVIEAKKVVEEPDDDEVDDLLSDSE